MSNLQRKKKFCSLAFLKLMLKISVKYLMILKTFPYVNMWWLLPYSVLENLISFDTWCLFHGNVKVSFHTESCFNQAESALQFQHYLLARFFKMEKEVATHSSVLAWRIPGIREPSGLPSMGSHRVGHDWRDLAAAAGSLRRETTVYWCKYAIVFNEKGFLSSRRLGKPLPQHRGWSEKALQVIVTQLISCRDGNWTVFPSHPNKMLRGLVF